MNPTRKLRDLGRSPWLDNASSVSSGEDLFFSVTPLSSRDEGAASFVKSWDDPMARIDSKRVAIRKAS